MADDSSRAPRKTDPIEVLERSDRRRTIVKGVAGTVLSGVLGYVTYPWVAGEKRGELVAGAKSVLRQLLEPSNGRRRFQEDEGDSRILPVTLDATGREYERFLASLNLRHLHPIEILRPHFKMRGTVQNGLPPQELWANNVATLRVADELRERLGVRLLSIASAYRSPAYNAMCPGAVSKSYHMQNMALDLIYDCAPAEVVKAAETLRAEGRFSGGIGRYPGFTHVDTRGRNADWG